MKKLLCMAIILSGITTSQIADAAARQFTVSASVPVATDATITATRVLVAGNVFQDPVNSLSFGTLSFNTQNGIWIPQHYFAIDVGVIGGTGTPNVTFNYGSQTNPPGQTNGLSVKSTATFVKVTGAIGNQTETPLPAHPKQLLRDIAGEQVIGSEFSGGFLRTYVGIYTGGDSGIDAAGGSPFTNADLPGDYQGTLTVTALIP